MARSDWGKAGQQLSLGAALCPQSLDSLSYVAIINIRPVNFHQIVQGCLSVSRGLVRRSQIVIDSQPAFFCYSGNFEGTLVPAYCCLWSSFFHQTVRQPGVSLDDLRKLIAFVDCVTHLLQFAD